MREQILAGLLLLEWSVDTPVSRRRQLQRGDSSIRHCPYCFALKGISPHDEQCKLNSALLALIDDGDPDPETTFSALKECVLGLLTDLEWISTTRPYCGICNQEKSQGHTDDCFFTRTPEARGKEVSDGGKDHSLDWFYNTNAASGG